MFNRFWHLQTPGTHISRKAMRCSIMTTRCLMLFTWTFLAGVILAATPPPTGSASDCGSLSDISEILWTTDTARLSVRDVMTLFPNLTKVTDASIAEAISKADPSTLPDIIINLQAGKGPLASKLFQRVDLDSSNYDSVTSRSLFTRLYLYYTPTALQFDGLVDPKVRFIEEFLSHVTTKSPLLQELEKYLVCRGFISGEPSAMGMFNLLFGLWFDNYRRYPDVEGSSWDSSGFENTFVGEYSVDGTQVSGLHSWLRLYRLEQAGELGFPGPIELIEPNILTLPFTWSGRCQPQGSMFVGSSHEFEMAIYTLCFLEMPDTVCNVSLGGHPVAIATRKVEVSFDPVGSVESAYPVPTTTATSSNLCTPTTSNITSITSTTPPTTTSSTIRITSTTPSTATSSTIKITSSTPSTATSMRASAVASYFASMTSISTSTSSSLSSGNSENGGGTVHVDTGVTSTLLLTLLATIYRGHNLT